jgi:hypothetical protein
MDFGFAPGRLAFVVRLRVIPLKHFSMPIVGLDVLSDSIDPISLTGQEDTSRPARSIAPQDLHG